jgi:hypothetical protein
MLNLESYRFTEDEIDKFKGDFCCRSLASTHIGRQSIEYEVIP